MKDLERKILKKPDPGFYHPQLWNFESDQAVLVIGVDWSVHCFGSFMASDELCVNTIRCLAADAVHAANSGHTGAPLGLAAVGHVLWSRFLNFDTAWLNRDRFVLSGGHASALLYSLIHLRDQSIISLDDLRRFRQFGSKCAGHPERHLVAGIDATTGPLGQGIANAVGLSMTARYLGARYNKPNYPLFDHKVYAFCGDGDLQEGIASEAASFAGTQKLSNLVVVWDDNGITICGKTDLAFTEDVGARFRSYGWEVITVADGNKGYDEIGSAIERANAVSDRPVLIDLHTTIGFGCELAGSNKVHGVPLSAPQLKSLKEGFGFDGSKTFSVEAKVYEVYAGVRSRTEGKIAAWKGLYEGYAKAFPKEYAELEGLQAGDFKLEAFRGFMPSANDKVLATRQASGICLNALAPNCPGLLGGTADLTPSTNTALAGETLMNAGNPGGRYIEFGIREHAMLGIANGIQFYGFRGLVPFVSTFFVFVQYLLPSLRISALDGLRILLVMTHDSIGVGEDGPTHQNVENFSIIRAVPGVLLLRPADLVETSGCYTAAFVGKSRPAVLCFSRQSTPNIAGSSVEGTLRGGYVVKAAADAKLVLIGTGTELAIAVGAAEKLGVPVQIVSMPCQELFDEQPIEYRRQVLLSGVPIVSVEAGISYGWQKYSHKHLGIDRFGMSAPAPQIYDAVGLTVDKVAASCQKVLEFFKGKPVPNLLDLP
jgi:transketolase